MTSPPFGRSVEGNAWNTLAMTEPETPPRVSVIVAHFEQPAQLRRVLLALDRQSHPADRLEVIVVDDGSVIPPSLPPGVRLVTQADEGFRLAAARNRGVEAATGDVLLFLDADTAPEPDYVALMSRLPAIAPESVVVGRRLHADLSTADPDARIEEIAPVHRLADPAWLRDEYSRSDNLLRADDRSYRLMIGAVLACSRWFALEVGGFDESFTTYGGEDWEWAWRCWLAGAIFAHEPRAVAWHDGPDWSGRESDPALKTLETRRLASLIPLRGSRPHALLTGSSDTLVVVDADMTAAQALVTVDSILRAAPFVHVRVGAEHASLAGTDPRVSADSSMTPSASRTETGTGRYRAVVTVHAPCLVVPPSGGMPSALADLTETVGAGPVGRVSVADERGIVLTIDSSRAQARESRWAASSFEHRTVAAEPVARRLDGDVSVAAHYGDWL